MFKEGIRRIIKDFNKTEIENRGVVWKEKEPCPIKVAGIPCFGVVKKRVTEKEVILECSLDPYYHSISTLNAYHQKTTRGT